MAIPPNNASKSNRRVIAATVNGALTSLADKRVNVVLGEYRIRVDNTIVVFASLRFSAWVFIGLVL